MVKNLFLSFLIVLALCPLPWAQKNSSNPKVIFEELSAIHGLKKVPGPGDWLARHQEPGQSFEEYLQSRPVVPDAKRNIIYIVLLGRFDSLRRQIILQTSKYIEEFYHMEVRFASDIPIDVIPAKARRVHPFTQDSQILTSYVIEEILKPRLPEDAFCLIAFTVSDLWPGEGWNFVFGSASLRGRVGVWSIYRNGDPSVDKDSYRLCLERTIKTGLHEIGHMLSMQHCIFYECLMNGSNHRVESDRRPLWLCPVCLRKVQWALKLDIVERYQKLEELAQKYGLSRAAEFYLQSLRVLSQ